MDSRHSNCHGRGIKTVENIPNNLVPKKRATRNTRRDVGREHSRQELVEFVLSLDHVGNLNTIIVSISFVRQDPRNIVQSSDS